MLASHGPRVHLTSLTEAEFDIDGQDLTLAQWIKLDKDLEAAFVRRLGEPPSHAPDYLHAAGMSIGTHENLCVFREGHRQWLKEELAVLLKPFKKDF